MIHLHSIFRAIVFLLATLGFVGVVFAQEAPAGNENETNLSVMSQFTSADLERERQSRVEDATKHKVMFAMGIALLLLVIATAALGIAMALYSKQVFVAHMVCAGMSVFLSIAHAVTAIVWFFPFG